LIKKLPYSKLRAGEKIAVSGSKSESNRLLILKHLYQGISLNNLSNSDDTTYLNRALQSSDDLIDISHAGTAMRFLTAYFASQRGREVVLTGSDRMQNRPIGILVDALRSIGADIEYVNKDGYPPLKIKGKRIVKDKVSLQGNVSSQYISALLLIAPSLENGLQIELLGKVTSVPYIKMTLSLLDQLGINYTWDDHVISVRPADDVAKMIVTVESDWSSASYFFSLVALSKDGSIFLTAYKKDSLQGDSVLVEVYKQLGVETIFENGGIRLVKKPLECKSLELDLVGAPDLAQTIAVTCFGLGKGCDLTGLHTLKIKETDRLVALDQELKKLGAAIRVTNNSLHLKAGNEINSNVSIDTYDDHRMAMAFAPLALKVPIEINDAEVVTKSYKDFWDHFDRCLK